MSASNSPWPWLRLQEMLDGEWTDRMVGRCALREMKAQMAYIETQRPDWPQRIVDANGEVLVENKAARRMRLL